MALLKKRVTEIKKHLYERVSNDAKAFRFEPEETDIIRNKTKYVEKHMKNLLDEGLDKEQAECYGYLAIAYMKLDQYDKAWKTLNKQLELAVEYKDEPMQRIAHGNLGKDTPIPPHTNKMQNTNTFREVNTSLERTVSLPQVSALGWFLLFYGEQGGEYFMVCWSFLPL